MAEECLRLLSPPPGGTVVDATLGLGGHALLLLQAVGPSGRLVGVDRDPDALARAEERLRAACTEWGWAEAPVATVHADFRGLGEALDEHGVRDVHAVLFDLGVSSMQLDTPERGFSFRAEGPLDMRMDTTQGGTAAELVNSLPEPELAALIRDFGEERFSGRIARHIVARRPLATTGELEEAVWSAVPVSARQGRLHPATRTFQALRIAVNDELAAIAPALTAAAGRLAPGGRLAVLSYHSLEDRIVKRTLERLAGRCICPPELPLCACSPRRVVELLTRKPLEPSAAEVERNPRARSARLRAAVAA